MSEEALNLQLPSAAIRRIVKLNAEVLGMSAEGVVAISQLTEQVWWYGQPITLMTFRTPSLASQFIETLVTLSVQEAQLQKRKMIKVRCFVVDRPIPLTLCRSTMWSRQRRSGSSSSSTEP